MSAETVDFFQFVGVLLEERISFNHQENTELTYQLLALHTPSVGG